MGRGQGQSGVFRKRINGLHQALAESGFADDQAAVVILNGAGHDFRRRSGAAIDQHDQRIIFAAIAMRCACNASPVKSGRGGKQSIVPCAGICRLRPHLH